MNQATGIDQSEPRDEGKWSHVWAKRKELLGGIRKEGCNRKDKEKKWPKHKGR
jgi:hypothetical protein